MNENLLVNIGELSKPATILIEKISDAVGGIFKPWQIKRTAKAKAEAESETNLILVKNEIEVNELTKRAMNRFVKEETKKQENIENITAKAIPLLKPDAFSEQMEDDWIINFFDKCRIISDNEMQILWSRILASQANNPNTYSKRTVNLLSSLDKSDAELFTNLCRYGWVIENVNPIIFDCQNDIYTKKGINFNSLKHLDSIGLISFNSISGYKVLELPQKAIFSYFGKSFLFEFKKELGNGLPIGQILLTQVGQELSMICNSSPDIEFKTYVIEEWKKRCITIQEL